MKFKFDIYQRPFKKPLRTSHGVWSVREGIIICLENKTGKIAWGEIAPLPWFGSETLSQASDFCQKLGTTISAQDILQIADDLPACQFAFESAWLELTKTNDSYHEHKSLDFCYLLPAGSEALTAWQKIYQEHQNFTFKWKIGVYPLDTELRILQRLIADLPPQSKLRLDANGGLNQDQAKKLLTLTDKINEDAKYSDSRSIEFIEQILAPQYFSQMLSFSSQYKTPLALDESVANSRQLKMAYQKGWRSIFVIKAAIMGFPSEIINLCQINSLDIVISSVFETRIGKNTVLQLAKKLDHPRALGFGIDYFECV